MTQWPKPTIPQPGLRDLEEWMEDGGCEATDGCRTEVDGICEHGYPSWFIYLRLV
jgi:hypothetical protein